MRFRRQHITDLRFNLPVNIFLQGSSYVAYTPALDLSTYGSSKKEAQANFQELVSIFFSEFDDSRELGLVLESLGWTRQDTAWRPPIVEQTQQSFSVAMPSQ